MIFTGIVIMLGLINAVIGTFLISQRVMNQVQDKVRIDLNTAREIVNSRIEYIQGTIYLSSFRNCIRDGLVKKDRQSRESLKECLEQVRKAGDMEMAAITDNKGVVILRAHNHGCFGDNQSGDQIVSRVLDSKEIVAGHVIVSCEELQKEGEQFSNRAHIKFIDTPKAKKRQEHEETSGMMLKAAAPIWGDDGDFLGIIYGGDLVNRNYGLVDKIKNTVYQGEIYQGMDMGTTTIFQKDLRISTNVMSEKGDRAIGTRVSEQVYNRVLKEGKQWIGRAFVVNAWYVTAYEPLLDIDGQIIGMLYVGMLEQKFVDIRGKSLLIFFGLTILGMILVLIVSSFFADTITKPIKYLVKVSNKISGGKFSVKVRVQSGDEIGELEKAFNTMASALQERDEKLQRQTQQQLMRSEKLAALGTLASGMAHSIRNPLTSVKMRLFSMGRKLELEGSIKEDFDVISHEMDSIESVVRNFLDFSRPPKMKAQMISLSDVVDMALQLLKPRIDAQGIKVKLVRKHRLPQTEVDPEQIQEVLVNIILNGCEATGRYGTITVHETEDAVSRLGWAAVITISDNGPGMSRDTKEKVFQPFYSTKEEGTGLGLSIAARIVEEHGGLINVESEEGRGSQFNILIPVRKKEHGKNTDR